MYHTGAIAAVIKIEVELEQENNGRWIAEVMGHPGILAYGSTRELAARRAIRLLFNVIDAWFLDIEEEDATRK